MSNLKEKLMKEFYDLEAKEHRDCHEFLHELLVDYLLANYNIEAKCLT